MQLQSLQEIFNYKFFRIPDYQRGYSWGKKQLEELWHDIEILSDKQNHYMGVLSVVGQKKSTEDIGSDSVFVVDGQQRITSLIILIKTILSSIGERKLVNTVEVEEYERRYLFSRRGREESSIVQVPIFSYDKDNPSRVHFQEKILELDGPFEQYSGPTLYTNNLDAAQKFFADKIKGLSFDEVSKILYKVTDKLKFNYYQMSDELNEFVAFETMNNRGKPLSDLELLKNRLIYLSTLFEADDRDKEDLRGKINEAWKTIYEHIGKPGTPFDEDKFLEDHRNMYFGYAGKSSSKIYKGKLLDEHFTADAISDGSLSIKKIQKYAWDIQRVVKAYYFMLNPDNSDCPYDSRVKCWLKKLNRLGHVHFKPLVAAMLTHYDDLDTRLLVDTLKAIEKFNFVAFNVHSHRKSLSERKIYECAHTVHKTPQSLSTITPQLELDNLGVSSKLEQWKFCAAIEEKEDKFYDWEGTKYFLYEYELYLQKKADGDGKVRWKDVNNETIEHIYPQAPKGKWNELFSSEEDKALLHDLGNLLLLSHKLNSKIKNSEFSEKSEAFSNNSYSAIEVSKKAEWNPHAVRERTTKLLDFLWERWGLQDTDEEYVLDEDEEQTDRRENSRFSDAGLSIGDEITYYNDSSITALVVSEKKVEFRGQNVTVSGATKMIRGDKPVSGWQYWTYDGERLSDRINRLKNEAESIIISSD